MRCCISLLPLLFALISVSCPMGEARGQAARVFSSSFESISDFSGFYIETQEDEFDRHELSQEKVYAGLWAHRAYIKAARDATNDGLVYKPHRAYPTVQLYKGASGSFVTPCLVTLYVYLDMTLAEKSSGSIDDWFSFATLSPDSSDAWARTVGVNIVHDGYVRLVHVPDQGKQEYLYQAGNDTNDPDGSLRFPYGSWVRLDIYIDFASSGGYAKVWQNGALVSHALVNGGSGTLEQAHFGLYASAAIAAGTIYNDALTIREVRDESDAAQYLE